MTDERNPNDRYVVVGGEFELLGFVYDTFEEAACQVKDRELLHRMDVAASYLKGFHEALYSAHVDKYPGIEPPESI
jgi:hypothetical protein